MEGTLGMNPEAYDALTPAQQKALRNRHPLYGRLSGEAVWVLLQECGLDEMGIDRFMDGLFVEMRTTIVLMDALERGAAKGFCYEAVWPLCPACASLAGRIVFAAKTDWLRLLPPFAVGCGLRCRLVREEDASALLKKEKVYTVPDEMPSCSLICDLVKTRCVRPPT